MKKYLIFLLLSSIIWKFSSAQNLGVGTLTPHPSAKLDVSSINSGFLVPRMTSVQRNGIVSPAAGLQVYDTNTKTLWYYNGTGWTELSVGGDAGYWSLGNGGNIYNNNAGKVILGTSDIGPGYVNIKAPLNSSGLFIGETGTTAADYLSFGTYSGGGTSSTRVGSMLGNFGGGFTIANQANAPLMFQAYNAERMRITPAGNVGINTLTPTAKLEVNTATGAAGITHTNGTIRLTTLMNSASSAAFGTTTNHPLFFLPTILFLPQ